MPGCDCISPQFLDAFVSSVCLQSTVSPFLESAEAFKSVFSPTGGFVAVVGIYCDV